jgi:hypothetical protein
MTECSKCDYARKACNKDWICCGHYSISPTRTSDDKIANVLFDQGVNEIAFGWGYLHVRYQSEPGATATEHLITANCVLVPLDCKGCGIFKAIL